MKVVFTNSSIVFKSVKKPEDIYNANKNVNNMYIGLVSSGSQSYRSSLAGAQTTEDIVVKAGDKIRLVLKTATGERPSAPLYCVFLTEDKRVINGSDYEDALMNLKNILFAHSTSAPDSNGYYMCEFIAPENSAYMAMTVRFNDTTYLTELQIYRY